MYINHTSNLANDASVIFDRNGPGAMQFTVI